MRQTTAVKSHKKKKKELDISLCLEDMKKNKVGSLYIFQWFIEFKREYWRVWVREMEGLQKFQHFNFVHSYSIIAFHVNKSQMPSENKVYQLNSPSIRVIKTNVVIGQLLKSGGGGGERNWQHFTSISVETQYQCTSTIKL